MYVGVHVRIYVYISLYVNYIIESHPPLYGLLTSHCDDIATKYLVGVRFTSG